MGTHHLIGADNGVCISQALFRENGDGTIRVLALIGATSYIDKQNCPVEEARAIYRDLLDSGWVRPVKTKPEPEHVLRTLIYN